MPFTPVVDPVVLALAFLRAAGALLVIAQGWWWCFVFGWRVRLLPAVGLTTLFAGLGAVAGDLCFRAFAAAVG